MKPSLESTEQLVKDWNASHAVGTPVLRYRLINPNREPEDTVTTSGAWVMGGHTAVIMVQGVSGCVALQSVQARAV